MNIAIIPARAGSKRIPNKNIKLFSGKPVIYYPIEAALSSKIFSKVIISTDSKKIAKLAQKFGAEAPFIRPKNLSNDYTIIADVMKHALKFLQRKKLKPNFVCCIFPVNPFIRKSDILKGYKKIINNDWQFVFTAVENKFPVYRSFLQKKNKGLKMIFPKNYTTRSQDLQKVYSDAGQFYWGKRSAWMSKKKIFSHYSSIINIPYQRANDIDTIDDWKHAELMRKNITSNK